MTFSEKKLLLVENPRKVFKLFWASLSTVFVYAFSILMYKTFPRRQKQQKVRYFSFNRIIKVQFNFWKYNMWSKYLYWIIVQHYYICIWWLMTKKSLCILATATPLSCHFLWVTYLFFLLSNQNIKILVPRAFHYTFIHYSSRSKDPFKFGYSRK